MNNKTYYPGMHYSQVKQLMQQLQSNIKKLRSRGLSFYMDESVILASCFMSELSENLIASFYPSDNKFLSLFLIPVVNTDSQIGFIDPKGNIVVEPSYDAIK